MQFVTNGPDIPEELLQMHEEGRLVFFCGAGISYPAGLPGFKELVDKIYEFANIRPDPIEQAAYDQNQFDATLNFLENRLQGQRQGLEMRKVLEKVLQPRLRRKGAMDIHTALLQLAHDRKGSLRLVTTNFDRIFEKVAKRIKQTINSFAAPMLPIPKDSRWNGLVYLHGLLPDRPNDDALQRLIVTSGDFGLAYLTERWAARFVSELFRNYVVCFVGYSINDPVMRYMMDALAADRMLGEATPQAYALSDCESEQEESKTNEWKAKGVMPILYDSTDSHAVLRNTLNVWADTYRDGILGKERIVIEHAIAHPSASTQQDDFVGRMLWALSHESGLPAKCFAEFNPVPSIEWLKVFSEDRYRHSDLDRFGILPHPRIDEKLHFSFIRRPAPYTRAPYMSLTPEIVDTRWDDVMYQLARWLVRHLNDPELIIWLAKRGGQLHDQWSRLIKKELDRYTKLERDGKTDELEDIRKNAGNAIPQTSMRILWRLLLTNRVKSWGNDWKFYSWKERLQRDGLTATLRFDLRELLSPKVMLKRPSRWGEDNDVAESPQRLKQLVDWELVLTTDHVHSVLEDIAQVECWNEVLPKLFGDFQQLLSDALDLLRELGEADDFKDRSFWDLPSISRHWQNRGYHEWVTLIELLRDAWLATSEIDHNKATWIARD
ncbi:SIR2 family protein [Nitrosomonas supralitoralis]|uniref:SIR2 family protein n=1 Tax=Nitrosomonas supralitoralis TaxID=2116706 RepID=UPI0018D50100|nr:SIR2 family protein [Nitrosomonas supralitoralis]